MEITPVNLKLFTCNKYILNHFKYTILELFFSVDNPLKLAILHCNSMIQRYLCLHYFVIIMFLNLSFNLANSYHSSFPDNFSIQFFTCSFCHNLFLYYCEISFGDFMQMYISDYAFYKSFYMKLILSMDHVIFANVSL